jgi:hypothetical protein
VSAVNSNSNGGQAARRETAEEAAERLKEAGQPVCDVVDENLAPVASRRVRVFQPEPAKAPPLVLPVTETAAEQGIKSKGRATDAAVRQDVETSRVELLKKLAAARARRLAARSGRVQAELVVAEAVKERDAFMERVPAWRRWRLGRKPGRVMGLVPWALWVADTTVMARPWSVFGSIPLPYAHSIDSSRSGQLVRAATVSLGFVFGFRFVGGRLRDLADRERLQKERVGNAIDLLVIGVVVASGVMVAGATAKMQAATVNVLAGGTGVTVPLGSLKWIVFFMFALSFAFGYFLHEVEVEQAQTNAADVVKARAALAEAVAAETVAWGEVHELRDELTSLSRREQLEVDEQKAHNDTEVAAHKNTNQHVYGVDVAPGSNGFDATTKDAKPTTVKARSASSGDQNGHSGVRGRG